MRKKWIEDLGSWEGFSYLRLKGVPMKRSKDGGAIDFDRAKLRKLVAKGILQSRIPICGKELKLLRSLTELSMGRFAQKLGLTYGAIYHWEKNEKERLSIINEVAVRMLCAEELGLELRGGFSQMTGASDHEPLAIVVTSRKPTKQRHKTEVVLRRSYRGDRRVRVRVKPA